MTGMILVKNYIVWHYTQALSDVWHLAVNMVWFMYHFFSIDILVRTLFSRWRRLGEAPPQHGFHPGAWLSALFVNFMMRLVGFFARLALICVGLIAIALTIMVAFLIFIAWFFLPVVLIGIFVLGGDLVLSSSFL